RLPHLDVRLIFRRAIAGQRGGIIGEFDHYVARARRTFRGFVFAGAHHEPSAVFAKNGGIGSRIGFVTCFIVPFDAPDPVTFRYLSSPFTCWPVKFVARSFPLPPWDRARRYYEVLYKPQRLQNYSFDLESQ